MSDHVYDVFIIGGGVNGCGIARDAAGRGLKVGLAEMNDLASATSSASTKLFHGGLRYLEYFEFRLVKEALKEREVLLRAMPHISWPKRFVLPYHPDMRFDNATPTSRLLSWVMPWMKGRRPAWLIRLGLFFYDNIGGRDILPKTQSLDLTKAAEGTPLKDIYKRAYEYSDCWVEDARLVVLNAKDAAQNSAKIMTRTRVIHAERKGNIWEVDIQNTDGVQKVWSRTLVNAAGPWIEDVLQGTIQSNTKDKIRLVRGSHIVVRKLFDHDKCYFFQGTDGRIIFAIPYEQDFTLIGTTDADHFDPSEPPVCTPEEQRYLVEFASEYFAKPIDIGDIVWTYSGVRPLYDDGAKSATAATRDYVLRLDAENGVPLINVFGGKITSYRKLSEAVLSKLEPYLDGLKTPWTSGVFLPGGDFPVDGQDNLIAQLVEKFDFLTPSWAKRLIRAYGTEAQKLLGNAKHMEDLGENFGATITARELDWVVDQEWVQTADDFLWRRSKLGLRVSEAEATRIDAYIAARTTV